MGLRALKTEEEALAIPLDQEILVELPGASTEEPVDVGGKANAGDPQDDGLQQLKDQLAAEQEARRLDKEARERAENDAAEARRQATQRQQEADAERARVQALEGDVIDGGLKAAQTRRDAAKAEFKAAFEAGDADAMANAQSKIGRAEAEILSFETGAAEIAERKAEQPATKHQQEQPAPKAIDPAAAIDAMPNLLAAEKDWLKKHPEAVIDAKKNNRLGVAFEDAMEAKLERGTPAYFQFLEERMGYAKPAQQQQNNDAERDSALTSAPPSRNERGGDGRPTNTRITLSPEQREIARNLGVSDIEYAKQVANFDAARKADPDKYNSRG